MTEQTYGIIRRVRHDVATARLIGEPVSFAAERRELAEMIRDARAALREIARIENHACAYDDDDRCNTCGADGRS